MSIVLSTFKFNPVDASNHELDGTRSLYANGRQQVKVRVTLLKQVNGQNTPLTSSEKESLTIVAYTDDEMPTEWKLSLDDNQYTQGLNPNRRQSDIEQSSSSVRNKTKSMELSSNATDEGARNGEEVFYFYISTSDTSLDPQDFEAIITLEDESTYRSGDPSFGQNFVTIQAYAPYKVDAEELEVQYDQVQYHEWDKDDWSSLNVYWFYPPSNETLMGCIWPPSSLYSWDYIVYDNDREYRALSPYHTSYSVEELGSSDVYRDIEIPIKGSAFRGCVGHGSNHEHDDDDEAERRVEVGYVDAYGCDQRYLMSHDGNDIVVINNHG